MWKSQVIKKEQKENEQVFLYIVDPAPILQTKNSNISKKIITLSYLQLHTVYNYKNNHSMLSFI